MGVWGEGWGVGGWVLGGLGGRGGMGLWWGEPNYLHSDVILELQSSNCYLTIKHVFCPRSDR